MGRKGNRVRIAPCIYRDGSGLSATVNVGRTVTEKRFPADGIEDARDWQAATRLQLRHQRGTATERGTLRHDAERYLRLMTHLVGFASRRAEIRAWLALHGTTRRDKITPQHVQAARVNWRRDGAWPPRRSIIASPVCATSTAPSTANGRTPRVTTSRRWPC